MTSLNKKWIPKSVLCLQAGYTRHDLTSDLIAGVTVGLVALPLAMAFGIASGVTPQAGIYTAVVAGFLISALGGSRLQIGGPTGAFVVIVAGIIAHLKVNAGVETRRRKHATSASVRRRIGRRPVRLI